MPSRQQRALLQLVREVSRRQIAPRAQRHVAGGAFPAEIFALLAELDVLGLPFAIDDGGMGQPTTIVRQVLTELSEAFLAVGMGTCVHLVATGIVADHAHGALREEVLPQLITGEWLAAHGLPVIPDSAGPPLRIVRDGDGYVVDGAVTGVTCAGQADCYLVLGRMSDESSDAGTMLLVTAGSDGLEASVDAAAMGHPVSVGTLRCREVFVPSDHRLGGERQAASIVDKLLDDVHLGVAACAVGLARAALRAAIACVRVHAGSAADARDLGSTIGESAAAVEAADALCERAAAACDDGRPVPGLTAMARIVACDTASTVTERAATVHRGTVCAAGATLSRYRREAAALRLIDGGDDVARLVVGREMVGDVNDDER
jgi:alkylation response protein AidB-like acyl-CoA dehydrogenase